MILISVGASEYPLNRLLKIVDELCTEKKIDGKEIIAQIGSATYKPINYKYFSLIGREEYEKYLEEADYIITHAGTGSVVPPLIKGKKIIVFPRIEKYKEHLDDHQLELCECFTKNGYTLCATNKEELEKAIINIKKFKPNKFISNKKNFNDMIINYIEEVNI